MKKGEMTFMPISSVVHSSLIEQRLIRQLIASKVCYPKDASGQSHLTVRSVKRLSLPTGAYRILEKVVVLVLTTWLTQSLNIQISDLPSILVFWDGAGSLTEQINQSSE
jgi:hypothetical protein